MLFQKNRLKGFADADVLAGFAVEALLEEVRLTPKPGLVDSHNNGSHYDLTLPLMELSAAVLRSTFQQMAMAASGKEPSQKIREELALIGRQGEQEMQKATGGINTHKGAIWAVGLLTGAAAIVVGKREKEEITIQSILSAAGSIAQFQDRYIPVIATNGDKVRKRYTVRSAREEAVMCFPSLQNTALPMLDLYSDEPEDIQRLNVLLALMAVVDDTCILNRSEMDVLKNVQQMAANIMERGGLGVSENWKYYTILDDYIAYNWISPGGSADLLAATIFIEKIIKHFKR